MSALSSIMTEHHEKMKRNTLYNFNSVQLTFNQRVFNRINTD